MGRKPGDPSRLMCCRSLRPILVKSPGTRLAREPRFGWGESLYRSQPLPDPRPVALISSSPMIAC